MVKKAKDDKVADLGGRIDPIFTYQSHRIPYEIT